MIPASTYTGSAKPRLITTLTSGTGVYVPTVDMARCLAFVQGGGAGGASAGTTGGGAGAMVRALMRIPIAGVNFSVAAAAAAATSGNKSFFHTLVAQAGYAPAISDGGALGNFVSGASLSYAGGMDGVAGGAGGRGTNGMSAGFQTWVTTMALGLGLLVGTYGGGGDSFFAKGGNGNNAGNGLNGTYGSGGGSGSGTGGLGGGGYIEIWDFGA